MAEDRTLVGGFHAVIAVIEAGRPIEALWLAEDLRSERAREIHTLAEYHGIAVTRVARAELDRRLGEVVHQGVIARLPPAEPLAESALPRLIESVDAPLLLALDQVQDPHNLGACLRSAAAAGASAVVAPRRHAAGLSATARKVAAGGAERVPFVAVRNLARCLETLKSDGFWVVGLDGDAPDSLYDMDLDGPLVIVAGSEARGLRSRTVGCCDWLAAIEIAPNSQSLNVSVAAGVALFEARRQRRNAS